MEDTERGPHRSVRLPFFILHFSFFIVFLSAASPSDDLLRQANDALLAGRADAALTLYTAAAERSPDPGLVAFNEGVALAGRGDAREAELRFVRTLDDRDASAERRARALYNRGVCLLHRGRDAAAFRTAAECFERCVEIGPDAELAADARHNLELAKLLWSRVRLKERTPPKASDPPPESRPEHDPAGTDPDPDGGRDAGAGASDRMMSPTPAPGPAPRGGNPLDTPRQTPGAGGLPVRLDDAPQPLTPDAARDHLKRIADRLRADRRANAELTAGPERPDVPNW